MNIHTCIQVYSNGKTQATGCKSIRMLVDANRCLLEAIKKLAEMEYP